MLIFMEQKIIFSIVGTVVVVITSIFGANVKKDLNEGKITEQNQIVATSNEVANSSEKEELDNKIQMMEIRMLLKFKSNQVIKIWNLG